MAGGRPVPGSPPRPAPCPACVVSMASRATARQTPNMIAAARAQSRPVPNPSATTPAAPSASMARTSGTVALVETVTGLGDMVQLLPRDIDDLAPIPYGHT